ncbi:MAG: class II fructose-bisphosphate aldolase [Candidatus Niyogibacteria bacterium]|nr:class II fructose-bisphosphate aldolase [Candidatus Niyogibacteria bacterium]
MNTTLNEWLRQADEEHWALPHFNISNLVQLKGVLAACFEARSPVMIGTSEGEAEFIGFLTARHLIDAAVEETGLPIFLNADHFRSRETIEAALNAGYDSALLDLSKENEAFNRDEVRRVAEFAHAKDPDASIEGELGYLVTESSRVYKETVEIPPESLTDPDAARAFVEATGIDRFAPAVGNLHGIAANAPQLDFDRIAAIRAAVPARVALVLHGGSGIPDDQMRRAIELGFNNIHVSTEIRVAYTDALRAALSAMPDETTPYKFYKPVVGSVRVKTMEKLQLFGSINRV